MENSNQRKKIAENVINIIARPPNKVLQDQTPSVSPAELLLSRETRRTLAQLRTNKSPLLVSYLFSIGDPQHPSPLCPLCLMHDHTSSHLFECKSLPTSLSSLDLWTNPDKVEPFLATWGERLLAATWFGCWTLLAARWWSGVDNNNNNNNNDPNVSTRYGPNVAICCGPNVATWCEPKCYYIQWAQRYCRL